ncbi:BnaA08g26650D [Brassica napus]|uniref:BnaA08g26650D protein n=1 Tax=Brassica napus TaxID=3708 RepID=A0A078GXD6_BRANA|nr:BnaA08g26650D [Brassica napus]
MYSVIKRKNTYSLSTRARPLSENTILVRSPLLSLPTPQSRITTNSNIAQSLRQKLNSVLLWIYADKLVQVPLRMVRLMDEGNTLMDASSDVEFACGDPKVEPRVGDEFQAEIPPMMSASKRAAFLSTPLPLDDSSYPFLVGQPVQVTWIDKHHQKGQLNGDDDSIDMNQSLKSLRTKRSRCSSKKQRLNLEAVPEIPSSSWEDHEVASFLLGLYTFGKNFTQLKKFMESKGTGEIVLFYYRKFYKSASYHSWSDSRTKRRRKCVYGRKLYSGWRQHQLLSRLIPSISDESQKQTLVNVSKSFAEGNITLEKYISLVKDLVGLKLLVEAVGIGKGKEDLTVITSGPPVKTKPWFTVSSKTSSSVPGLDAYTSLTSADIINQLTGSSRRLSKARCSDIFWEAVWPRLLARGWRSEQPKERSYFASKDNIVFIVPGVKEFSRGELVKGDDYFDSVSDILTKVAMEPELLEFETGGEIKEGDANAENSSEQSDEGSSPSDKQKHRYLKSPCSNRGSLQMNVTVVDTSLVAGGKLCDLRNLNTEPLVCSVPKTRLGDELDCQNVEMPPSDGRKKDYLEEESSIKEEEEETLERVKDPSKRLIKHRSNQRAEANDGSVSSAPSLKRRRLSACVRSEKSLSRDKHSPGDESTSDQSKNTGSGPSSAVVEIEEMSEETRTSPHELIFSEQEPNGWCSLSDSNTKRATIVPKQEKAVELPSLPGSNGSPSNDLGTTQELGSLEQQQQHEITDAPRRQSTRKRPLTTRALEALESSYLTTKEMKSTVKPRKRAKKNRSAKACNSAQPLAHNGSAGLEKRGEDESKATDQIEDSKPSLPLNGATTATMALDQRQDSKTVPPERPRLPPIVLKFSLKRRRGASETQV